MTFLKGILRHLHKFIRTFDTVSTVCKILCAGSPPLRSTHKLVLLTAMLAFSAVTAHEGVSFHPLFSGSVHSGLRIGVLDGSPIAELTLWQHVQLILFAGVWLRTRWLKVLNQCFDQKFATS